MYMEEDDNFDDVASGAANTVPQQCSALRKNGFVVIRGHPCKIVQMSTSKTGKHGSAKVHLVGLDIFTSKKFEDICSSTRNINVPKVTRKEYTLINISRDGYFTFMDDKCELVTHLKLTDSCSHKTVAEVEALMEKAGETDQVVQGQVVSALKEEVVKELRVAKG